ncbi:SusC/RagA family TonB-linked outer membrane protein [Fulvivirga sediminis]|uniref:SusC/RagA family TonB-linked outer membrane protein n=1 Tax=Fulvivirga sediminis TaxID=2803949 RepID=A0A937K1J2_9BACT|nr:SusC/RagA family TonB-linked outer membrane protein [Fulvivirga sediminis]MBL3656727.1 SusC/RagA family TonB-linked outer membrane protein [Fulvivirga sediminis]
MSRISLVLVMVGVLCIFDARSQSVITGKVVDKAENQPIPGVAVLEQGTSNGTITDVSGNFSLSVGANAQLIFSFVGYESQTISINGRSTINVEMSTNVTELNEVVVTALGVEREKKALGYSITEVGGEEVSTVKESNVINSLAGKVAGVVVSPSTFGPGSSSRVVLRGNNSLTGNNQPLYVIDGVPMDNSGFGSSNQNIADEYSRADYGNGIADVNPDDIASISVLKGANAAALYGSRASNGVILITTKKGGARKGLGVGFSSSVMFSDPLVLPEFQNQYGQGAQGSVDLSSGNSWGAPLDGSQKPYFAQESKAYSAQPDNVKNFFRTGSSIINTLTLSGGNEKANLRFSYTNALANSILPNSEVNKHNFNMRAYAELTDKLSFDGKVTYANIKGTNRPTLGTEGIMSDLYTIPRNVDINDLKDYQWDESLAVRSYTLLPDGSPATDTSNPYWVLYNDHNDDVRNRTYGYFKVNYQFTDNFSAFGRIGGDFVDQNIETVNSYGHWFYGTGRFSYGTSKSKEINADFLLSYNDKLSDKFSFSMNVGGNHRYEEDLNYKFKGTGFKIPTQPTVESAITLLPTYSFLKPKKVNSLYGSAQLSFQETVFLDITARNDWSSSLPADNMSYFYPSASLSVLVNEFIDPDQNFLNFMKIRGSWAQVGNDTDPYQLANINTLDAQGYLGRTTLSRKDTYFDENIGPEQVTTVETGVEWKMLNNRIYGEFTYYHIKSKDLIWGVGVSASNGYKYHNTNVGYMTNQGVEILLGGSPIQTNDFSWGVSVNMAHNRNQLEELIGDVDNYMFSNTNGGTVIVQATAGGGFGDIYGTDYMRDPQGNVVINADGTPRASSEKVYLGNYQPDWVGGLMNTFTYKDFTLRLLIDARIGGEVYSGADASLDVAGVSERSLQYRQEGVVLDGVVETTPSDAEQPVYEQNTTNVNAQQYFEALSGVASNYVYDQTNIRMREVSLMYRLPQSIIGNTFIKSATIGLIGRNLFFLSKKIDNFDPESSYSTTSFGQGVLFYNMPTTRNYGFSVSVNF